MRASHLSRIMQIFAPWAALFRKPSRRWPALALASALLAPAAFSAEGDKTEPAKPAEAKPAENKFLATLIWGTDGDKPQDKDLKEVDPALKEKFSKIFKWKNYYEVKRKQVSMSPGGDPKCLDMSDKCQVKIHWKEKEGMEVELIGEGKLVEHRKYSMPLTEMLVLAGDDKNATAWFVVLKPE